MVLRWYAGEVHARYLPLRVVSAEKPLLGGVFFCLWENGPS